MSKLRATLIALGALGCSVSLVATAVSTAEATPPSPSGMSYVYSCSQGLAVGLNSCFAQRRTDIKFRSHTQVTHPWANPADAPSGYGPTSLWSAYGLPGLGGGSGQRVYIVDAYNDPNVAADLAVYRSEYGLPACTIANGCFKLLNQNGATSPLPAANSGWAGEISLDVDMVSAACPNCAITLIEATNNGTGLYTAVKEAGTLGAKFVSLSWGGSESSSEASVDSSYFASSGIVYSVSSGDGAYRGGVEYPSSSPSVVSVGGTSLSTASNARGWSETAWETSTTEGAGSGCSKYEAKPSWQSPAVSASACAKRAIADVSAVADPYTGVAVYQTYGGSGWTIYGGTSAAAPIIASTYALSGTPTSGEHPASLLYANAGSLWDVTSGSTGSCSPSVLCTSGPGWDGPTGLGTPNGLTAFGGTGGGGGGGSNVVTVTNPGSQTGTVGGSASLAISASDSGSSTLSYSATGLPAGLSINSVSGAITGSYTASGTSSVTVTATDTTGAHGSATFSWTVNPVAGGCTAAQLLLNPGFESGSANWSATSGVINTDGAHSRTGSGYVWIDGYGRTHTDTLAQSVKIPSGCHATLTYYLYISSSDVGSTAHDTLVLKAGSTAVQSFSNVNRGSGYVLQTVNLSAYAGQTVTLTWTGTENNSLATSFFIDDTALNVS